MAVNPLTSGASTTDADAYSTASITPGANRLVIAAIEGRNNGSPVEPTLVGCGITWALLGAHLSAGLGHANRDLGGTGNDYQLTVFAGFAASPSNDTLDFDFGSTTMLGVSWTVFEFDDADLSDGLDSAIRQIVENTGTATSPTPFVVTLAAGGDAGNYAVGIFASQEDADGSTNANFTPGSGFTQIHDVGNGQDDVIFSEYVTTFDTTVDALQVTSGGNDYIGIAFEVVVADEATTAEVDAVLDEVVAALNAQQRYLSTISTTVDETQASLRAYLQPGPNIDATIDEASASLNLQQRYLSTITSTVDEIAAALNARSFHGTTVGSTLDKVTASFGLNQRYLATIEATVDEAQASLNAAQTDLLRVDADLDEVLAALELLADVSTEIDAVLNKVTAALAAVVPTDMTIASILDEVVAALGVAEVDEGAAIIRWIATRARLQRSEPGRSLTPAGVGIARREPGRGIAPRVSRRIER